MCTHNLCFEQKYDKYQNVSTEFFIFFLASEKSVYCMGVFQLFVCIED